MGFGGNVAVKPEWNLGVTGKVTLITHTATTKRVTAGLRPFPAKMVCLSAISERPASENSRPDSIANLNRYLAYAGGAPRGTIASVCRRGLAASRGSDDAISRTCC